MSIMRWSVSVMKVRESVALITVLDATGEYVLFGDYQAEISAANARIKQFEAVNLALIAERDQLRVANGDFKEHFDALKSDYDALLKEREAALKQEPVAYSQQNGLETSFCSLQYQREYNVPLETLKPLYSKPMPPAIPEGMALVSAIVSPEIESVYSNSTGAYQSAQELHDAMIAASRKGGA